MKNLDATECEIMYQAKDDPANAFSPLLMALGTQIPLDAIMTTQLMNELNQLVEASPEYGY